MSATFEQMPDHARVWVYQAQRKLSNAEIAQIQTFLESKVSQWQAHGASLKAAVKVLHGYFVVLAVDELFHSPSGCSIDASTHWFKEMGVRLQISFFDRSLAFWQEGDIVTIPIALIKQKVAAGILSPQTLVFDNTISTLSDIRTKWQVPAIQTWLKRYFQLANA